MKRHLIIGTRQSKLALWQANYIAGELSRHYPDCAVELVKIVTSGDRILDVPLAKIGGKGLFTKEIEQAMLDKKIDLAVHSLKDMPTELPEGLTLAAITERAHAGDAFVSVKYASLAALPAGAVVGTSSLRRRAQLLRVRPDLTIVDLRGNLDTRLAKLDRGEVDAIVLAVAGLVRLGWSERVTEILSPEACLPAVGQGALAIEAREDDAETLTMLSVLNDEKTRMAVTAERAFLGVMGGGCQVPVGVHAVMVDDETVKLKAIIASLDGKTRVEGCEEGPAAQAAVIGEKLADRLLLEGGAVILQDIM